MIETYHRGIKQFCGIERYQAIYENAQCNHIDTTLRAFIRREYHCFVKDISWFEVKISIVLETFRVLFGKANLYV